jgi:hypothetical protein
MKRSFSALLASGLLLASATLATTGCANRIYYYPEYNYAGRPTPPSGILQRVLAAYTANGTQGGLEILDGLRDIRSNVQDTIKSFSISGYSEGQPTMILNFPEETIGYVFSNNDGALTAINYSKESSIGSAANFLAGAPSAAAAPLGTIFAGAAEQAGALVFETAGVTYDLNLPNVNKVVIDQGAGVVLAMVRNSNTLYRVVKLPATPNPTFPAGAVDCEPLLLPAYCVVPVGGPATTTYDRPTNATFSLDGTTAYVLNSGPEYGGTTSSVAFLQMAALNINNLCIYGYPNTTCPTPTSPLSAIPVANPIPVPGGATVALSDSNYLYLAGQQLQRSGAYTGLFAGNLSLLNLSTYAVGAPIPISDGTHTKILFADNNTLWIGSSQCANGVRAAVATQELASQGFTDQAGNYNCLSMVTTSATTTTPPTTATIIPAVVQTASGVTSTTAVGVPYPNTDQDAYYYGSLTGLCWVQNYGKIYTAYGGQIHAFATANGAEINNYYITVQGTVYDVAYMDALTNYAN